jgi:hypothetical protein
MLELGYCVDNAIPHSVWLEKWSAEDRSKVVAYMMEQADRCDFCGTAPWEWDENRFAYEPEDHFCQGCYYKSIYSDSESQSLPGTNVRLVPVTPGRLLEKLIIEEKRKGKRKSFQEDS